MWETGSNPARPIWSKGSVSYSLYEVCPEGIQPCNMKNGDIYWRRYKIQEILYTGQWCLSSLQNRCLGTSHSSPNCHQLPHRIFLNLINGLKSLLFQRWISFWGKPEIIGHQIWAVEAWVTRVIWCFTKNSAWDVMLEQGVLSWWSCQSPVAHSFSFLNHSNSFCIGVFKFKTKLDVDSLLYLFSYFECNSHTIHMCTQQHLPPPLTSRVKSSLFMHAHSSPFSLAAMLYQCHTNHSHYINNGWTFSGLA